MRIGIIAAMPEEFRVVAKSLGIEAAAECGGLPAGRSAAGGNEYLLVESGIGFDNAARAAETVIKELRPGLLVSTGFCGGIAPELRSGDVIVARQIAIAGGNGLDEVPVQLSGIGQSFVATQYEDEAAGIVGGVFISTPVLTSKSLLAESLPAHYRNPVVDMESGAIAIIAAENSIPLLAIRAVSDPLSEELGFSLEEFCDSGMRRIRPGRVLLTILRKPWIVPQLFRLSRSSRKASAGLSAALCRLFAALQDSSRR